MFIHVYEVNTAGVHLIFHSSAQHLHSEFSVHTVQVSLVDSSHAASSLLLYQTSSHNTQSCKETDTRNTMDVRTVFFHFCMFVTIILQF